MCNLENQSATVGCSFSENLTEAAQFVVHCESEGYVLVDVFGFCEDLNVLDEHLRLYILTNHVGIYRCIIMRGSDYGVSRFAVRDDAENVMGRANE